MNQSGQWENQDLKIDQNWIREKLEEKIKALDWDKVKEDVRHFLNSIDRQSLKIWSSEFFISKLKKLTIYN